VYDTVFPDINFLRPSLPGNDYQIAAVSEKLGWVWT